jgi:hypothetical protein
MAFTGLRCGNCGAPSAVEVTDKKRAFYTSRYGFEDAQKLTEQIYLGFANEDAHLMASVGFV